MRVFFELYFIKQLRVQGHFIQAAAGLPAGPHRKLMNINYAPLSKPKYSANSAIVNFPRMHNNILFMHCSMCIHPEHRQRWPRGGTD